MARGEDGDGDVVEKGSNKGKPYLTPFSPDMLDREDRETFDSLPIAEQRKVKEAWLQVQPDLEGMMKEHDREMDREVDQMARDRSLRDVTATINDLKVPKKELNYWGDDEDDELGQTPDGDDGPEGDMTSMAHEELSLHREIREYARMAAWDMPLLSKFAKPYSPPPITSPLRFRYTTYMGEHHPAARKVVVEFCPLDLPLSPAQQLKLKKLVGARYNPSKDIVHMSSEKFDTPAQNKRYLGDLIDTLIAEAKDPNKDTFEDIPLDLRHHKEKKKPKFPSEWYLNENTAQRLQSQREEVKQLASTTVAVDGEEVYAEYIANRANDDLADAVAVPMAPAHGRRKGVRR